MRLRVSLFSRAALAVLLCAGIAGCGGNGGGETTESGVSSGAAPAPGGTVVRRIESECKTLNPVLQTTTYENYVARYLYDRLIDWNEKLEYVPVLAEGWDVSDDHIRITVHLRDDIFWHDGTPITSQDVAFTMARIRDPAVPALNTAGYFSKLDHVETPDDRTAVFVWREPYAPAIAAMAQLVPLPKHIYGNGDFLTKPANRKPVDGGPFRFEDGRNAPYISSVRTDD